MSRLILAVVVAAILGLVGAFVPVGGKTLVERWNTAARPAPKGVPARPVVSARPARAPGSTAEPVPPEPVEHHTEADRSALDRIVAEHAADRPAARP